MDTAEFLTPEAWPLLDISLHRNDIQNLRAGNLPLPLWRSLIDQSGASVVVVDVPADAIATNATDFPDTHFVTPTPAGLEEAVHVLLHSTCNDLVILFIGCGTDASQMFHHGLTSTGKTALLLMTSMQWHASHEATDTAWLMAQAVSRWSLRIVQLFNEIGPLGKPFHVPAHAPAWGTVIAGVVRINDSIATTDPNRVRICLRARLPSTLRVTAQEGAIDGVNSVLEQSYHNLIATRESITWESHSFRPGRGLHTRPTGTYDLMTWNITVSSQVASDQVLTQLRLIEGTEGDGTMVSVWGPEDQQAFTVLPIHRAYLPAAVAQLCSRELPTAIRIAAMDAGLLVKGATPLLLQGILRTTQLDDLLMGWRIPTTITLRTAARPSPTSREARNEAKVGPMEDDERPKLLIFCGNTITASDLSDHVARLLQVPVEGALVQALEQRTGQYAAAIQLTFDMLDRAAQFRLLHEVRTVTYRGLTYRIEGFSHTKLQMARIPSTLQAAAMHDALADAGGHLGRAGSSFQTAVRITSLALNGQVTHESTAWTQLYTRAEPRAWAAGPNLCRTYVHPVLRSQVQLWTYAGPNEAPTDTNPYCPTQDEADRIFRSSSAARSWTAGPNRAVRALDLPGHPSGTDIGAHDMQCRPGDGLVLSLPAGAQLTIRGPGEQAVIRVATDSWAHGTTTSS